MMKSLAIFAGLLLLTHGSEAQIAPQGPATELDTEFVDGFTDVPHLPDFQEVADSRLVFDTPGGTIAAVEFVTKTAGGMARYHTALENIGWACAENGTLTCQMPGLALSLKALGPRPDGFHFLLESRPLPKN